MPFGRLRGRAGAISRNFRAAARGKGRWGAAARSGRPRLASLERRERPGEHDGAVLVMDLDVLALEVLQRGGQGHVLALVAVELVVDVALVVLALVVVVAVVLGQDRVADLHE